MLVITHSYNCSNHFVVIIACYKHSKSSCSCETHSIANCGSCSKRERVVVGTVVLCITAKVAACVCVTLHACVCARVCSRTRACVLACWRGCVLVLVPSVCICTHEHIHEGEQAFRPARTLCIYTLTHVHHPKSAVGTQHAHSTYNC